jgi:hypothetical protein
MLAELTAPDGERLCVDAGSPMVAGNPVTLEVCAADPLPQQVWGSDDSAVFFAQPNPSTMLCLRATVADTPGVAVALTAPKLPGRCDDAWSTTGTFIPDPHFGSGKAGPETHQLVNWEQFSRCIDVAAEPATGGQLIVFPCQQPLSGAVRWDQNWVVPGTGASAVGRIYTELDGTTYCLRSPDSTDPLENHVTVESCDIRTAVPAAQRWTVNAGTGGPASHRIESSYLADDANPTHCMSPTDPTATDPDLWVDASLRLSRLVLVTCDGTDLQQWNASTHVEQVGLKDIVEK